MVAPVDANIFPAGFNNICDIDKESAEEIFQSFFSEHYPNSGDNILLLCEEHTKNAFYWENVRTLKNLIESAGKKVLVAIPSELSGPITVETSAGHQFEVFSAKPESGTIKINGTAVDMVVCNNDFTQAHPDWVDKLDVPITPPYQLGWYQRKKSDFFDIYNNLMTSFAEVIDVEPWRLTVETEVFPDFDISDEASRNKLGDFVDEFIDDLQQKYTERGIEQKPFVFVKNNSGTYGLAVNKAHSGDDVRSWNYKDRKKMKAVKGGGSVSEVIVQEGIPSQFISEEGTAEPTIYLVGDRLIGGFLRSHSKKGPTESLNSPGAVYKRLCVSDLQIKRDCCPMENVYGWVSKIGALAIAHEANVAGIKFPGYQ